jgi:hypothetical protein
MFVYYFVHLNRPFSVVEPELVAQLNQLGSFADAAYREGEDLRDKIDRIGSCRGFRCEETNKQRFRLPGKLRGRRDCFRDWTRI